MTDTEPSQPDAEAATSPDDPRGGLWRRFKRGLGKTRTQLAEGVGNLILGEREISEDVLEELETALLITDVGVETTTAIMDDLRGRVSRKELNNTTALHRALGDLLVQVLKPLEAEFALDPAVKPQVVFFVGVNGAGKTTTLGKLAQWLKRRGASVMLAAGDTFRAAAVEQLTTWGERNGVPVVAQSQGSDSASVVFDAVQSAQARGVDVLLADTAGRLQAKSNLMDELSKIKRVVRRLDDKAPHEVLLILDGTVGQNALSQAREFDAAVGVTGYVVTKLDGSAKAGVLFALAKQQPKPVYFIGIGEQLDDLQPFAAQPFVDALLASEDDA
ncbi:MAG: signal recognition particle-docking protein FtsY [Pseudomonadota bacterium]